MVLWYYTESIESQNPILYGFMVMSKTNPMLYGITEKVLRDITQYYMVSW